jgi:pimeloyl-ACP methyl ester carboxylesterase
VAAVEAPGDLHLRADDGRRFRVQAAPASAGYPLLVHPGTPGSRHLFRPQVEKAARVGFRLISWDRPGYGETPGRAGRRVADAARDAVAVADRMGLERFATWGFSGGGPFALACAALLPDRVSAAVVIASLAPYDAEGLVWASGFSERAQAEVRLFFEDPAAHRKMHAEVADEYRRALSSADGWFAKWGEAAGTDDARSRAVAEHLALGFRESMAQGDEGWFEDDVAFLSPWGFDVAEIRVPVQLWHGGSDANARVQHGLWLADHIPGVDAHIVEGEDHTNIEMAHEEEAWRWLLSKVAADSTGGPAES